MIKFGKTLSLSAVAVVAVAAVLMLSPGKGYAAQDTCTWTGVNDGDINDATNWTGCDNGNLPEDGDDLNFPNTGVTTYAVNWNLPVTPRHITVSDSAFTFGGTQIIMSGTLQVFAASSPTFNSTIIFQNNSVQTGLNVQGGQPTFGAGITFNVTGGGYAAIFTSNSSLDLPAMSGTVPYLFINGNALAPTKQFHLASGSTLTVTNTIDIQNADVVCSSADCLGNSNNHVRLSKADTSSLVTRLTVDTPTFGYDVTALNFGTVGSTQLLRLAQSTTLSGDLTADPGAYTIVNIDDGVTATFSGTINNNDAIDFDGVGSSSSKLIFTGDIAGGSAISISDATALFNGTNSHISSYVNLYTDSVIGGTGMATAGIHQASGHTSTLAPGLSPGCLSTGFYNGTANGQFVVEIAGTTACTDYDQLNASGPVTFNDVGLSVALTGGPYAVGTVFTIINADSIAGTFGGLADGATITAAGHTFRVNYTATTVTLTVVSAPDVIEDEEGEPAESAPAAGGELTDTGTNSVLALLLSIILVGGALLTVRRKNS